MIRLILKLIMLAKIYSAIFDFIVLIENGLHKKIFTRSQ